MNAKDFHRLPKAEQDRLWAAAGYEDDSHLTVEQVRAKVRAKSAAAVAQFKQDAGISTLPWQ